MKMTRKTDTNKKKIGTNRGAWSSEEQQEQKHSSSETAAAATTTTESSLPEWQTQQHNRTQQQQQQREALVAYNPVKSLSSSVRTWYHNVDELMSCKEMETFVSSSQHLVSSLSNVTFHMVCLPIAIPLHLTCETMGFLHTKCKQVQSASTTLAHDIITQLKTNNQGHDHYDGQQELTRQQRRRRQRQQEEEIRVVDVSVANISSSNSHSNTGESTSSDPPLYTPNGIMHFVFKTTDQVKNEIGSSIMNMIVSPVAVAVGVGDSSSTAGQSSSEQDGMNNGSVLDRLRLDYVPPNSNDNTTPPEKFNNTCTVIKTTPITLGSKNNKNDNDHKHCKTKRKAHHIQYHSHSTRTPSSADTSKFLLFVADLNVIVVMKEQEESPVNDDYDSNYHVKEEEEEEEEQQQQLLYIDLGREFSNPDLTKQALDQMFVYGVSLFQNNTHVQIKLKPQEKQEHFLLHSKTNHHQVQWKPEGSTANLLRRKGIMMTEDEWIQVLRQETLIWSGKFVVPHYHENNNNNNHRYSQKLESRQEKQIYLARGIVKGSPKEFLHLLWDNTRTSEYNNFCMGRSNLLVINSNNDENDNNSNHQTYGSNDNYDSVLNGANYGTKVVKSETRVPFTGFSVVLTTMMHVRPLSDNSINNNKNIGEKDENDSDNNSFHGNNGSSDRFSGTEEGSNTICDSNSSNHGYIILSRTLDSGKAGYHMTTTSGELQGAKMKNEILWGINVLRPVPNYPHLTDLTSLSQVSSSMVPKFLSHQIGMMGIEDFFKNVRENSSKK